MENERGNYKVQTTKFSEENQCRLSGELFHYGNNTAKWKFTIFSDIGSDILWEGGLQDIVELVLLGKLCKEHLTANTVLIGQETI